MVRRLGRALALIVGVWALVLADAWVWRTIGGLLYENDLNVSFYLLIVTGAFIINVCVFAVVIEKSVVLLADLQDK